MEEKRIPFVIDNRQHSERSLDIATTVGGWRLLSNKLSQLGTLRILLGDEPELSTDIGMREAGAKPVKGLLQD